MYLTITANPALDTFYALDCFCPRGGVHRLRQNFSLAGGKANNTARALRALEQPVTACGFLAGRTGQRIDDCLTAEGIKSCPVWILGESRICTTVTGADGIHFELLEEGPVPSRGEWQRLAETAAGVRPRPRGIVAAGSPEAGARPSVMADLLQALDAGAVPVLLDMRQPWLEPALEFGTILKINVREWRQLWGEEGDPLPRDMETVRRRFGLAAVIVTAGSGYLQAAVEGAFYEVQPPSVPVVSAVGCGDLMNASMIHRFSAGDDWPAILMHSTGLAAAGACTIGAAVVDVSRAAELAGRVRVERKTIDSGNTTL